MVQELVRAVDLIGDGYDVTFWVGQWADYPCVGSLPPGAARSPAYLEDKSAPQTPWDLNNHGCLGFAHTDLHTHWTFEGADG